MNQLDEKDFAALMRTETGRRVLGWIIYDQAQVEKSTYSREGGEDRLLFLEGRKAIGVELLAFVKNLTPELYLTMVQERVEALLLSKEKRNVRNEDDSI